MSVRRILALGVLAALSACTPPHGPDRPVSANWREVASEDDRERLREWRDSLMTALAKASAAGNGDRIAAEGALLQPDAVLGGGIPNGRYHCRTVKLGARRDGLFDYVAYPAVDCSVSQLGTLQRFIQRGGAQRPSGTIFPADRLHSVFLGALSLGDETAVTRYGVDPDRDMAGWVERIGDARWRIVLPAPRLESVTDVIELTPAP